MANVRTNDRLSVLLWTFGRPKVQSSGTKFVVLEIKPGFHMSGKRSGILLFPDRLRFCRLMKTRNLRYPRLFGMNGDKSGESGAFLFSRCVPDFCDGRRSFPTNENSNLYRPGHGRLSAMDFVHYQASKLLGSSPLITNK